MSGGPQAFDVVVVASSFVGAAAGPARLSIDDAITLEMRHAIVQLPVNAITSCGRSDTTLRLIAGTRGSVELTSPHARAIASALAERACVLPELTLAMRSLGSRHGGPAPEHDRFFGPLLRSRALSERARDAAERMRAFDATALEASLIETVLALAQLRHAKSPPHRRAMEAQLLEFADPLLTALRALGSNDERADDTIAVWCEWSARVRAVFVEADRFWQRTRRFLDAVPPPSPRVKLAGGH